MARHELSISMSSLLDKSTRLLKKGGQISLAYPPERLSELMLELESHKLYPSLARFVHGNYQTPAKVVLVSASQSRSALLRNAGIVFEQDAAVVDEGVVKESFRNRNETAAHAAKALAALKAQRVSKRHPGTLIIGADQMLQCRGIWFDKPRDLDHARDHLRTLRGKTHELLSAVCVVRDGDCLWSHFESAHLTMRAFSNAFLDEYLAATGDVVCTSVGAYHLEGQGAQLFSRIEGDYFTILGLPLLPLLGFLVKHEVVTA